MSAVLKYDVIIKTNFRKLLNEQDNNEKEAELSTIKQLIKYSSSQFFNSVWILDKRHAKVEDMKVSYKTLSKYGHKAVYLTKLFVLILLERGITAVYNTPNNLRRFFMFLESKNIHLLLCGKSVLPVFEHWLGKENLSNASKKHIFRVVIDFFHLLYGHSSISKIEGVKSIQNPFLAKQENIERYKVINNQVLEKLDSYFLQQHIYLHIRVAYWILRLYGVRPADLSNYPLVCVRKLSNEVATINHAIVKTAKNTSGIDFKLEYLNILEPKQKMLYNLILQQQEISNELQYHSKKKHFLFTYGSKDKIFHLTTQSLRYAISKANTDLKLKDEQKIVPRDFKKTAITLRAQSGWTSEQLKIFANHNSYDSLDSYSKPSDSFITKQQSNILRSEKRLNNKYMFNGKIINNINSNLEKKILNNPRAHKLPNLGFCPSVSNCGNHFECLDCEHLIPDFNLKYYYLEQADRYLDIAKKQNKMEEITNAHDSFHRASLFASLYNRTINEKE